jgi:hypothetical protein
MEFLVRWVCPCESPQTCSFCDGQGYFERWMPPDLLTYLKDRTYVIISSRVLQQAEQHCDVLDSSPV